MTQRGYYRILPARVVPARDVYRRRFATRAEAEQVLNVLQNAYQIVEYAPNGKRRVRTTSDGRTIE